MSKEEMIQHLCNHGWERSELEMMDETELQKICGGLPAEIAEGRIYDHYEQKNYMFFSNVENIHRMCEEILKMNEGDVDAILSEHGWAIDHMATSKDDIEEVYSFLMTHEPSEQMDEAKKWIQKAIKRKGDLRKKMGKGEGEKISASEINDELSKLKKKDKDPDKEGLQLSKTDRRKHKQLVLAKTLRGLK
jgi:hypothetical protein